MARTATTSAAWRSSSALIIFTGTLGLFTENFLYSFVVPIISYMFEVRLRQDAKYTQRYASGMLFILGAIAVLCAPLIGHLADKTSNRKIPLLISLAGCLIGTVLVAATWSVWSVFVGRLFEGIAGTGAWIVSFAMMTDNIDKKHYGKILGLTSSFIGAGVLTGPVVAGTLLEWLGYWPAWSIPFSLLFVCLVARLVMVEKEKPSKLSGEGSVGSAAEESSPSESSNLLVHEDQVPDQQNGLHNEGQVQRNFYRVMLGNASCLAALLNIAVYSTIITAFDATFPLHLGRTFGWGPAPTGLIFLAIQVPGLIMAPIVGWLRDRHGVRWSAAIGWLLHAPFMWFAGVPGTWNLPGLETKTRQEAAFVGCIIGLGVVNPLVRGAGTFQNTITLRHIQERNPGIFGPHGGSSRLFALTEVIFNVGLMFGPLFGGALADTLGFHWMMFALAVLCMIAASCSSLFLTNDRMS